MSLKVAIAQINSIVGDIEKNRFCIADFAKRAAKAGADIVITPELSLIGYPPEDLLFDAGFYEAAMTALEALAKDLSAFPDLHVLVGHHFVQENQRFNACSILANGKITNTYCKRILSHHFSFNENRYFSPGSRPLIFTLKNTRFAVHIGSEAYESGIISENKKAGIDIALISDASPYCISRIKDRLDAVKKHISKQKIAAIYTNLIGGQDELVFDGNSFATDHEGKICLRLNHCKEDMELLHIKNGKMVSARQEIPLSIEEEIYRVLVLGTHDYIEKNGFPGIILGLSGGIDSALVLAIAVDAIGKDRIKAVMMPSPYTSEISIIDAEKMAKNLGIQYEVIPIHACFDSFLGTLSNQFAGKKEDTTEENIQARIRGTILMALSNKTGKIVLTTGNKSELAVGYCTLYGDMAGGFSVICDIPKTGVYKLSQYRNQVSKIIPERILTRAPSAELKPDQKDQDTLPPYDILDAIIQLFIEERKSLKEITAAGHDEETVKKILSLIRRNEYKRRQAPIGIRISSTGFGHNWRHPVTSKYRDSSL